MTRFNHKREGAACIVIILILLASWAPLSPDPGSVLWTFKFESPLWAPMTLANGYLYIGTDGGTLYALDTVDRAITWRFETGGKIRSRADVTDGLVTFASDDGFAYAVNQ